jgi:hypothetical protein
VTILASGLCGRTLRPDIWMQEPIHTFKIFLQKGAVHIWTSARNGASMETKGPRPHGPRYSGLDSADSYDLDA